MPSEEPARSALGADWPAIGASWIGGWAVALHRDLRNIESEIAAASDASDPDAAHSHLENALWRLDSAREKIHAIIAIAFAVPGTLKVEPGSQTGPKFMAYAKANRAVIRALEAEHPAAAQVIRHDDTLNSKLLLRHQVAHSLAPLTSLPSLTAFEVGLVRDGGVVAYEGRTLVERVGRLKDISTEAMTSRSINETTQGFRALVRLVGSLADLISAAAILAPPVIVWRVDETGANYPGRDEASAASRAASHGSR